METFFSSNNVHVSTISIAHDGVRHHPSTFSSVILEKDKDAKSGFYISLTIALVGLVLLFNSWTTIGFILLILGGILAYFTYLPDDKVPTHVTVWFNGRQSYFIARIDDYKTACELREALYKAKEMCDS